LECGKNIWAEGNYLYIANACTNYSGLDSGKISWKIEFKLEIASRCKLSKFPIKCRWTTSKLCKKFPKSGNRLESAEKYSKVYAELNLNNFWLFQIRISRIYSSNVHTLCKFFETNISYP